MFFSGLDKDKYDRQYDDTYLAKRIFSYFSKFRRELIIVVISFVAISVLGAVQPLWIADAIGALDTPDNQTTLLILFAALFGTAIFQYFANWLRRLLSARVIGNVVAAMRKDAFSAAVDRDLAFYDQNKSGKIVSRITTDTQEFGEVILIATDVISQLISVSVLFFSLWS
jgi:ATP-binding cassette subfamily B protein